MQLSKLSLTCIGVLFILCIAVKHSTPAEFLKVPGLHYGMPRCTKDDRDINECLKSAIQQMVRRFTKIIPELGLVSIDPWVVDLNGYQYSSGNIQTDVEIKNLRVYGLSKMLIDKVDFRLLKDGGVRLVINSRVPHLFAEGLFSGVFTFNELKIKPKGYFNISIDNFQMTRRPEGKLYKNNGHTYLRLFRYNAVPEVDDLKIYISGLLPDPTLNNLALEIINQYWRQIYRAMWPESRASFEPLLIINGNAFFKVFPLDLILETKN